MDKFAGLKRVIPRDCLQNTAFKNLLKKTAAKNLPAESTGTYSSSSYYESITEPPRVPKPRVPKRGRLTPARMVQQEALKPPVPMTKQIAPPAAAPAAAGAAEPAEVATVAKKWLPAWFNWKWGALIATVGVVVFIVVFRWRMIRDLGVSYAIASMFPWLGGVCSAVSGVPRNQLHGEIAAYQSGVHPILNPGHLMNAEEEDNKEPRIVHPRKELEGSGIFDLEEEEGEEEEKKEEPKPEPEPEPETESIKEPETEPETEPTKESEPEPETTTAAVTDPNFDENGYPVTREGMIRTLLDEAIGGAEYAREAAWEQKKKQEQEELERERKREEENAAAIRERQAQRQRQRQSQQPATPPEVADSSDEQNREEQALDEMRVNHQRVLNALAQGLV